MGFVVTIVLLCFIDGLLGFACMGIFSHVCSDSVDLFTCGLDTFYWFLVVSNLVVR